MRAIALDPPSSYPFEWALVLWSSASSIGYAEFAEKHALQTEVFLTKAQELAGPALISRAMIAIFEYLKTGDTIKARQNIDSFMRDMPFDGEALVFVAFLFLYIGDADSAEECFEKYNAFAANTIFGITAVAGMSMALVMKGKFEDALPGFDRTILTSPNYPMPYRWTASALAHLGRMEEARAALKVHYRLMPGMTISRLNAQTNRADTPGARRLIDGLKLLGVPE